MKHFIVEITYKVSFEEMQKVLPAHRIYLDEGYEKGILLMSGPQNPKTGGIVIARANDENQTYNRSRGRRARADGWRCAGR